MPMGEFVIGCARESLVLEYPVHQLFQGICFVAGHFITALSCHQRQFAVTGKFQMIAAVIGPAGSDK